MTGFLDPEVLDSFKDENGTSFVEAATAAGYPAKTSQAQYPSFHYLQRILFTYLCIK
jgi:hypothetical protein